MEKQEYPWRCGKKGKGIHAGREKGQPGGGKVNRYTRK